MSDEAVLGRVCCIKRTTLLIIATFVLTLYSVFTIVRLAIYVYVTQKSLTPNHCSGPRCNDIVSCSGLQEGTWHLKEAVLLLGGLVFGPMGLYGVLHRFPKDVYLLSCFFLALVALYTGIMFTDLLYTRVCEHYPYNIIDEGILWDIPRLPVAPGIKYEIRRMSSFPVAYTNSVTYRNAEHIAITVDVVMIIIWTFLAYQAWIVAQRCYWGRIGLGATFSIEDWRENLLLKWDVQNYGYRTLDMAAASFCDLGWEYDDYFRRYNWVGRPVYGRPQFYMPWSPESEMMGPMMMASRMGASPEQAERIAERVCEEKERQIEHRQEMFEEVNPLGAAVAREHADQRFDEIEEEMFYRL